MSVKSVWGVIKDGAAAWYNDSAPRLGAALSFYTVFAVSPLLIIIVFIAGLLFRQGAVQQAIFEQLAGLIGKRGADAAQSMMHASIPYQQGVIAAAIAIVTVLVTSTGVFIELQGALNTIWGVERKPGHSLLGFVKDRMLSFAMVVGIGFLLLVSLVISAALAALGKYVAALVPGLDILWLVVNGVVSFAVITVLFAMIFKVLPDVKIAWQDVWVGAAVTALLFTAGKFLLGFYLGRSATISAYGAAGSIVLILLWVYYSAQILFFGAELTQIYANRYGVRLEPKAYAKWKSPQELAASSTPKGPLAQRYRDGNAHLPVELREKIEALQQAQRAILRSRRASHA